VVEDSKEEDVKEINKIGKITLEKLFFLQEKIFLSSKSGHNENQPK
jgi:hypothetical protein